MSFCYLYFRHREIKTYAAENVEIIIIGTNSHLYTKRKITQERAENKAEHLECKYMDISAEYGTNIRLAFETLADAMLTHETKPKPYRSLTQSWYEHNHQVLLERPKEKKCQFCFCQ